MKPCLVPPGVQVLEIIVLNSDESIKIPIEEKEQTVEDVCTFVAKKLNIKPICRLLFSLQVQETLIWLHPNCVLQNTGHTVFIYRLRFKPTTLKRLKDLDLVAFDYYYHQVRRDVLSGRVRGLNFDKSKNEVLGLTVTDMYRVLLEKNKTKEQVESEYKKYVPKPILKNYGNLRHKISDTFSRLTGARYEVDFVKYEYLKQFEEIAGDYLYEEFSAQVDHQGSVRIVNIFVNPFHAEFPGVLVRHSEKEEWKHLCTIDELCFISIRDDGTVEICRANGIPIYYKFPSNAVMFSFVSLLDGYYRLTTKWTFNLCKDVFSNHLIRLAALKCHGPVGGLFSYAKLQEKRENEPGTYILRESEKSDNVYYLDVCKQASSKPKTFRIDREPSGDYKFSYDNKSYPTLLNLISTYKLDFDPDLKLIECVLPSDYDKSHLLLCATETWAADLAAAANPQEFLLTAPPQCINVQSLQVFQSSKRESLFGTTWHFRAIWKHRKGSHVQVAIKELKPNLRDKYLSEFLDLAGRWASVDSNVIVKLYGVTLTGKISMVTEYLNLGPLDKYLQEHQQTIAKVDLVQAGASLAMAVWQLEEAKMTHGYIRCKKLLVAFHDDRKFIVKLTDPGLHELTEKEIPWIAPELYGNFAKAKILTSADVYAFGTTLWEIFSMGRPPIITDKRFYQLGHNLQPPKDCPSEIYKLMCKCWEPDYAKRKRPQTVMRDINHILYQVFNSRRVHSYATAFPSNFLSVDSDNLAEVGGTLRSNVTDETLISDVPTTIETINSDSLYEELGSNDVVFTPKEANGHYLTQVTPDLTNMPIQIDNRCNFFAETIFDLGNSYLIQQERIGEGFYGEVFKGLLDRKPVAIKKLKSRPVPEALNELEREISIMQQLDHPNIVKIRGSVQTSELYGFIMEYFPLGNLLGYIEINKDHLKPKQFLKFSEDIAKGMEYLGRKKIVHRDLAARNVLVASENHVKISDFGLARGVNTADDYYLMQTMRELPINWYAPETIDQKCFRFSSRSDVWSYGVTLFELFSYGEEPRLPNLKNHESSTIYTALSQGIRLHCPPGECAHKVYCAIMKPCWSFNTKERPTFSAILDIIKQLKEDITFA